METYHTLSNIDHSVQILKVIYLRIYLGNSARERDLLFKSGDLFGYQTDSKSSRGHLIEPIITLLSSSYSIYSWY